jgi:hypothetical protein
MVDSVTIRLARDEDAVALLELAVLDSAAQPEGEVLIADVGGRPTAALELATGRVIADPFEETAQLVELLRLRARALLDPPRERSRMRRAWLYAGSARWSTR